MEERRRTLILFVIFIFLIFMVVSFFLNKPFNFKEEVPISGFEKNSFNEIGGETTFFNWTSDNGWELRINPNRYNSTQYAYFKTKVSQDWSNFEDGNIVYNIRFSNNSQYITRVVFSLGDKLSGGVQKNKANYAYAPIKDDWQNVFLGVSNPILVNGIINFEDVKELRFNIEYDFPSNQGSDFTVFIKDLKLVKIKWLYFVLYTFFFLLTLLLLLFVEFKYNLSQIKLEEKVRFKNKSKRAISLAMRFFSLVLISLYMGILVFRIYNPNFLIFVDMGYFLLFTFLFGASYLAFFEVNVSPILRRRKRIKDILVALFLGVSIFLIFHFKLEYFDYFVPSLIGAFTFLLYLFNKNVG